MTTGRGGKRDGAGRKLGSKNKLTIAREVVAEVIHADDPKKLTEAVHARGYQMLLELERIVLDPTQPVAARIMAAKTALPFMVPKQAEHEERQEKFGEELIARIHAGRERVRSKKIYQSTIELEHLGGCTNEKP